jgi:deoxyribodipyrimidine photo-lyase
MSSPVSAWEGCSRLSPYLAFGNVSMRQVVHAAERRRAELARKRSEEARGWRTSLAAFGGRLRWHCHFMQKLEDETRLEFENLAQYMNGLREESFREDRFEAWARGETGYPMVDACMRALLGTGWVNFRMRAMLVSFASYDLWLHWRRPGLHLARHFLDFEPGIHWSQVQMQSGSTGINTLRTYSPTKQLRDHDPTGVFVRRWVPELARVSDEHLAEPWRMPPEEQVRASCIIGRDYPRPIVDHNAAIAEARARIMRLRRGVEARAEAQAIVRKHGSRRGPMRGRRAS